MAYCLQDTYSTKNVKWRDREALVCSFLVKSFLKMWKDSWILKMKRIIFVSEKLQNKPITHFFYSQQKDLQVRFHLKSTISLYFLHHFELHNTVPSPENSKLTLLIVPTSSSWGDCEEFVRRLQKKKSIKCEFFF